MKQTDIIQTIDLFTNASAPNDRYSSFDYCYNYFRTAENYLADMKKSCLILGFYLASWGMFRGSSFILGESLKYFEMKIEYISLLP